MLAMIRATQTSYSDGKREEKVENAEVDQVLVVAVVTGRHYC